MEKIVCGVDLGGTKINTGLIRKNGEIIKSIKVPTIAEEGPDAVINRIKKSIRDVSNLANINISDLEGIGLASPGPLDSRTGLVIETANLPGWHNVPVTHILNKEFGIPVKLQNDANAAAYGEYMFGTGNGISSFAYITISTGIGGGVVINGKLYDGINSNSAEIGHHMISFEGPTCGCGNRGCFEAYASGTALAKFAQEEIAAGEKSIISDLAKDTKIKAEHVFKAAKLNDKVALKLIENEKFYLGIGIANIIAFYNPGRIAVGGGVSHEWDMLKEGVLKVINERGLKPSVDACEIVKAKLADEIGILGAAALIF